MYIIVSIIFNGICLTIADTDGIWSLATFVEVFVVAIILFLVFSFTISVVSRDTIIVGKRFE